MGASTFWVSLKSVRELYLLMANKYFDPRDLGANCDLCPFDGQRPTLPTLPKDPTQPPKITVLLEGPGDIEEMTGKAAQGKTGVWLHKIWRQLNVKREEAAVRNATMCKPREKSSDGNLRLAVDCCRPRLQGELTGNRRPVEQTKLPEADSNRRGTNVGQLLPRSSTSTQLRRELVLVCGGKALQAINGKTIIEDWRGYPVLPSALYPNGPASLDAVSSVRRGTDLSTQGNTVYFPTFHPMFVARKPQYWHIFRRDLRVAWDFAHGRLAPMEWPTLYLDNDSPAEQFLFEICERLEAGEKIDVGVDVETQGDWRTRLLIVGIATVEGSAALLYPFANEHIDAYVRFILAHPNATLVVQNGTHDQLSLERAGFKLNGQFWDTIVASRVAYPDLPHDLGFLATLFFFCDRWKSEFHAGSSQDKKGGEGWDRYLKEEYIESFLRYNAKDALSQVLMKAPLERRLAHVPRV